MSTKLIAPLCATALCLSLGACSGAGAPSSVAALGSPQTSGNVAKATFVMHWPARSVSARGRRPAAVSPSTQSVSISVNGGAPQVLNASSGGTSSVAIDAPIGTDSFQIETWDQTGASGRVLDQAVVSQQIRVNAANVVNATLDAVCAALLIGTLPNQPFVEATTTTSTGGAGPITLTSLLRLVGPATDQLTVTPLDADGNAIVYSGTAPAVTLAESGAVHHISVAASGTAGVFNVTPLQGESSSATTQLTATSPACGSGTPFVPNSVALTTESAVYAADLVAGVLAYDQDGNALALPSSSVFATLTGATGVAYDSVDKLIVVETYTTSTKTRQMSSYSLTGTLVQSFSGSTSTGNVASGNIGYNPVTGYAILSIPHASTSSHGSVTEYSVATGANVTPGGAFNPTGSTDYSPYGVAVTNTGAILIGDNYYNEGYEFDQNGKYITTLSYGSGALAFDVTNQSVYGLLPAAGGATTLYDAALSGNLNTSFTLPEPANGVGYNVSNNALYLFGPSGGINAYDVTSQTTNYIGNPVSLPGAFPGLSSPSQLAIVP